MKKNRVILFAAIRWMVVVSALITCGFAANANAASLSQDGEQTRKLWDSQFFKPAPKAVANKPAAPRRRYRIVTPNISTDRVDSDTVVGITLWRLRPATPSDDKQVRLFKHAKDNTKVVQWTPERISVDTPLAVGQRVRLSIESARTGYLYVIDRELYADGSMGEPYLIFPTTRLRNGNNQVTIGRIIDIPTQEDSPNYFNLEPDRADLVGEVISVLVTQQPLPDLKLAEDAVPISKSLVAEWERNWSAQVGRLELENFAGKAWTKEEKDASAANGTKLKQDSPAPQTLYYQPGAKASDPLMVSVKLRYGSAKPAVPDRKD
ncbi:MAG: hypothetical protein ABI977_25050 [Acidobacteriota bacterium]